MMESDTTTLDNNVSIPIGGLSGLQSQRHENGSTFLCFDASTHPGWSCFYWKVWSWWLSFKSSRKWDSALNTRGHELWKLERHLSLTGTESLQNFCPCSKPTGRGCPWWNFPVVSVGGFAGAGQAWRSGNHNRRVGGPVSWNSRECSSRGTGICSGLGPTWSEFGFVCFPLYASCKRTTAFDQSLPMQRGF